MPLFKLISSLWMRSTIVLRLFTKPIVLITGGVGCYGMGQKTTLDKFHEALPNLSNNDFVINLHLNKLQAFLVKLFDIGIFKFFYNFVEHISYYLSLPVYIALWIGLIFIACILSFIIYILYSILARKLNNRVTDKTPINSLGFELIQQSTKHLKLSQDISSLNNIIYNKDRIIIDLTNTINKLKLDNELILKKVNKNNIKFSEVKDLLELKNTEIMELRKALSNANYSSVNKKLLK